MTERIHHLLDEAVAGVQPRDPDPVPALLRRAGRDRRRRWAMGGAAVAVAASLIAVGGFATVNRPSPPPIAAPAPPPDLTDLPQPAPAVSGGVVRAGGVTIAVPPGWTVSDRSRADYCDIANRTILLGTMIMPGGDCNSHSQLALGLWRPTVFPAGMIEESDATFHDMSLWNEVVLPGGQPLWLDANNAGNIDAAEDLTFAASNLVLPWARMQISTEYHRADESVLSGIASEPAPPATLGLPVDFTAVALTVKGKGRLRTDDPAVAAQVLELLRGLDRPVQPGELPCPGARQLSKDWKLAGTDMAALAFLTPADTSGITPRKGVKPGDFEEAAGLVAISADDSCAFATSAMGGRVHLPAGFLGRLQQLLGGR